MVRTHGWGPRGQRLREQAPHGHWQTLTFLAALRARPGSTRLASLTDQRRKLQSLFQSYIAQFLVPTLKPGDMVIMDSLGSHKGYAVRRAIRRREASVPAALQFLTSILSSI